MATTNDFLGFTILDKLGEGAFSATYLAAQEKRTVAIKLIEIPNPYTSQTLSQQELQSKEFQDSLRQTSADLNQNLRTLVGIGEKKGILHYFDYHITVDPQSGVYQLGVLTEKLDNLAEMIGKSGIQVRQVLKMGMELCDGLRVLQEKRVYNGNIKESNIFYDRIKGFKLNDFFFNDILVQSLKPSPQYTDYGYRFLAPEAYDESIDSFDFRTDMFTLSILMYKLLNNGLLPFQVDGIKLSNLEIRKRFLEMKSLPTSPFIETPILNLLNRAAAFDISRRYNSYTDFKNAIKECMRLLDLSQLDRYLNLKTTYPLIYSPTPPKKIIDEKISEEIQIKEMEIPKENRPKLPEGVPFTIEIHKKIEETLADGFPEKNEPAYDKRKNKSKEFMNKKVSTAQINDPLISSLPTGEYVLGPNEKALFSNSKNFNSTINDYPLDEDDFVADYNYFDEEETEENPLKNRIALLIFFFALTIFVIALFLFLPHIQNFLFGNNSSSSENTSSFISIADFFYKKIL